MAHIWSPNFMIKMGGGGKYIVKNGVLQNGFSMSFSGYQASYANWQAVNNYPKTGLFEIHTAPSLSSVQIAAIGSDTNIIITGFSATDIGKKIYIEFEDTDELIATTCFLKGASYGGYISLFGVGGAYHPNATEYTTYIGNHFFYGNKSSYPKTESGTRMWIGRYKPTSSTTAKTCTAYCMARDKIRYIGQITGTSFTISMAHVESDVTSAPHYLLTPSFYSTPESSWTTGTVCQNYCYTLQTFVRFKNLYIE